VVVIVIGEQSDRTEDEILKAAISKYGKNVSVRVASVVYHLPVPLALLA